MLAVGASTHEFGKVTIVQKQKDRWKRRQTLTSGLPEDILVAGTQMFGKSIALDDSTLVVGAPFTSLGGVKTGAAFAFAKRKDGTFAEFPTLLSPGKDSGARDFGCAVALRSNFRGRDDVIVVGAEFTTFDNKKEAGAAYVFVRNKKGEFPNRPTARLVAQDAKAEDIYGARVAFWHDWLLISAPERNDGTGAIYFYEQGDDASKWNRVAILEGSGPRSEFGWYFSTTGRMIYVAESYITAKKEGVVQVFVLNADRTFRRLKPIVRPTPK
jgi:hypothetical protein